MPVGCGSQADYTDDSRWLGYDGLDRLTVANSRDQNARMQWGYGWGEASFEYDALDNLRRFRMGPLDMRYHHDSQQRLQGITLGGAGFRSYAHNARGQMTQREHADRLYSLSWDSAHRLLSTQAPGHSESYRYDAHGHRVRTQRSGETVWSVYSRGGTLLFEQTSLGQNRRHIHLGARQVAETRNGQRRYLHTDHLGTPRVQTDAFGTVVQRDVRAPYGSVLAGFDYRQGAGFTGHMEDGATALTYMKARYYDPVAMRFLGPDPVYVDLGTGGNFNRYWYANNNPYTNVDPDGRIAGAASKLVKLAIKGGDVAATFAGVVDDTRTLFASDSTWVERVAAGASLATEIVSPVSARDAKAIAGAVGGAGDARGKAVVPYKRPSGATTPEQRASVQGRPCVDCGEVTSRQVADHRTPLVQEHYETGTIDRVQMRSVDAVQPQCPTCSARQGAEMSRYSRQQKKKLEGGE